MNLNDYEMELNKGEELDLCATVWMKVSEFEEKFKTSPTDIVLPYFLKDHLIRNILEFGDTYINHKGQLRFMGFVVHWTMIDNTESIIAFQSIS